MAGRSADELVCPACGVSHGSDERFCSSCGVPLTFAADEEQPVRVSDRHRVARKVKPQLSEGKLVQVAGASNQAEAEFIQSLLLEEGVPSVLRRTAGFDVPDFLAAGPRDVLVPGSGVATARETLLEAELISSEPPQPVVAPAHLLIGLLAALAVGALVVWAITSLH